MATSPATIRVVILGAGKGGAAMLELFTRSPDIQVVGIADHGCVDGVENLRQAFEAAGIVVFKSW